jgi:hypothetical protein
VLLGNGNGSFQAQQTFAVGNGPDAVAAGDINGDGKLDLAVVNNSSNSASLLLGNGNGTFRPQITFGAPGAYSLVMGDFNGDSKLDLVLGSLSQSSLTVLLGRGNGTFQSQGSFSVAAVPVSLVEGDFNADGRSDLAVANQGPGTVSELRGNGDGTFQHPVLYDVGTTPETLAAGDFDGNGLLDLAVTIGTSPGSVSILLNRTQRPTSTLLVSSANPSVFGQTLTLQATVTGSGSSGPTGTVTFVDGATTLGAIVLSAGSAQLTAPALTVGSHALTAIYSGDANFTGSTSSTLSQTVQKDGTTASVVSSVNPALFGRSVKFTATIGALAPGSGTPTGTVTFLDGATPLATAKLSGGHASLTENTLSVSVHTITVTYGGNANFTGSTSGVLSQTIKKDGTTTVLISSLNPSASGQAVKFTATVTANAPGSGVPGGAVTFFDGSTTLGIRSLNGGQATFTTSGLSAGQHLITVAYAGSSSYKPSTSTTLTQTVNVAGQVLIAGLPGAATPAKEEMSVILAPTPRAATSDAMPARHNDAGVPGAGPGPSMAVVNIHRSLAAHRRSGMIPFLDLMITVDHLFADPGGIGIGQH